MKQKIGKPKKEMLVFVYILVIENGSGSQVTTYIKPVTWGKFVI
jgi:hypothetical protein